jgi:hypothetical protein
VEGGCLLPLPSPRWGERRMDVIGVTCEDRSGGRLFKRFFGRSGYLIRHMDPQIVVSPGMLGFFRSGCEGTQSRVEVDPLRAPI